MWCSKFTITSTRMALLMPSAAHLRSIRSSTHVARSTSMSTSLPRSPLRRRVASFAPLGYLPELEAQNLVPIAGLRLRRTADPFPLDVFPPLDPERYDEIARRRVYLPFGDPARLLPFLSVEDLTVFKLSFGRDKDWVDLRNICRYRPDLDVDYVEHQLVALRGHQMYPRLARLRGFLRPVDS